MIAEPLNTTSEKVDHLSAALAYTARGWFVVPACWPDEEGACACPRRHTSSHEIGKAPWLSGYQLLRPTEADVRRWWTQWPDANIAVLLKPSGLIDIAPDSTKWWRKFQEQGLSRTAHATSGGGAGHLHYFYRQPDNGPEHRLCRPDEFDLLSDGIAILPPSRHRLGARYGWLVTPEEMGKTLPVAPLWAVEMLRGASRPAEDRSAPLRVETRSWGGEPPVPLDGEALDRWRGALIEATPGGQVDRSTSLFAIGRALAKAGADESTVAAACEERDRALGWNKYAGRRDGPRRYGEIAIAAVKEANQRHIRLQPVTSSGESAPGDTPREDLHAVTFDGLFPTTPPTIPWLIEAPHDRVGAATNGLLAHRNLFVLGANSGLGKTWMWLDLVVALSMGLPFLGHFKIARPQRVMLVDEESSLWLLQQRLPLLLRGRGIPLEQFRDEGWKNVRIYIDQGFSFDQDRSLGKLQHEAETFGPTVVLFDSLSRIHRRAENDNSAMAALFEDRIKPFSRTYDAALGFAHHTRKPSKEADNAAGSMLRGASDLRAQLDQFWFLRGRENVPKLIFEHDKCRPAPALSPFTVIREQTEDGGIAIRYSGATGAGEAASASAGDTLLAYLIEHGPTKRSDLVHFARSRRIAERTVNDALAQLFNDELIAKEKHGKDMLYSALEDEL